MIDHIKLHYIDKDLKRMDSQRHIHLNYHSVIQVNVSGFVYWQQYP
jgi:hypothetical protein